MRDPEEATALVLAALERAGQVTEAIQALLDKAETYADALMPGFTHCKSASNVDSV